jgi:hypothetical protein
VRLIAYFQHDFAARPARADRVESSEEILERECCDSRRFDGRRLQPTRDP